MAVIKCPECHREMSDVAEKCPNCGYPYAEKIAIYHQAKKLMMSCETENSFRGLAELFRSISGIYDSDEQAQVCLEKAEAYRIQDLQREEERVKQQELQSKQNQILLKRCEIAAVIIIVISIIGFIVCKIIYTPKATSFDAIEEMQEILQGNWQTTFYYRGNVGHKELEIFGSRAHDRVLPASNNSRVTTYPDGIISFYPEEGRFSLKQKWDDGDITNTDYFICSIPGELIIVKEHYSDKEDWYHRY